MVEDALRISGHVDEAQDRPTITRDLLWRVDFAGPYQGQVVRYTAQFCSLPV
ncbi:MAG: hypothetical protein IPH82_15545 [Chloroflexi bacterium]|nr:hypothetical protein [Chloroflexota bacterium]